MMCTLFRALYGWDEAMLLTRRVSQENKYRGLKPSENEFFSGVLGVSSG